MLHTLLFQRDWSMACMCVHVCTVTRTGVQSKFPEAVLKSLIRSLQWLGPGFTEMTEDGLWTVRVQDSTGDRYLEMCFSLCHLGRLFLYETQVRSYLFQKASDIFLQNLPQQMSLPVVFGYRGWYLFLLFIGELPEGKDLAFLNCLHRNVQPCIQ